MHKFLNVIIVHIRNIFDATAAVVVVTAIVPDRKYCSKTRLNVVCIRIYYVPILISTINILNSYV